MELLIVAVLYGLAGVVYLSSAIFSIRRNNDISIFDLSRLMYSAVFGFIPMLIYINEANGQNNLYLDYSLNKLSLVYIVFVCSIVAYCVFCFSYKMIKKNDPSYSIKYTSSSDYSPEVGRQLFFAGIILFFVGIVCFLLWTRAYGTIFQFIQYASVIRSGRSLITNRFAYMKQFVILQEVALVTLFSAFLYSRPKGLKRFVHLLLISLSLVFNYLYLLASESRSTIVLLGISLLLIALRHRKHRNIKRYIIISAVLSLLLLFVTINADSLFTYVRYGSWISRDSSISSLVCREFRFTLNSEFMALETLFDGKLKTKIIDDFILAVTRWVPERFIPFDLPESIWDYNTRLLSSISGTAPSDFLATSIYEFGILGLFLFPLLYGLLLGFVEKVMWSKSKSPFIDVFYSSLAISFMTQIVYCGLSDFVLGLFPLFVFYLLTRIIKRACIHVSIGFLGEV